MPMTLLIDMDDTLYPEQSYVESGFRAVADHLAGSLLKGENADHLTAQMLSTLAKQGRGQVFNSVLATYGLPISEEVIQSLVTLYRNHSPTIQLYDGVYELLSYLKGRYRLALVTDGLPLMQVNKVRALELDQIFDTVFYTWTYQKKPHVDSYRLPLEQMRASVEAALVIGDNPINDGQPAAALHLPFWQIYSERQTRSPYADRFFMSFVDIGPALEEIE